MSVLAALLKLPIGEKYKNIVLSVNRCEILINIVAIIRKGQADGFSKKARGLTNLSDRRLPATYPNQEINYSPTISFQALSATTLYSSKSPLSQRSRPRAA